MSVGKNNVRFFSYMQQKKFHMIEHSRAIHVSNEYPQLTPTMNYMLVCSGVCVCVCSVSSKKMRLCILYHITKMPSHYGCHGYRCKDVTIIIMLR